MLTVSNNAVGTNLSSTVRVYATNYNVLRIMSGINFVLNIYLAMMSVCGFALANHLCSKASCLVNKQGQTV